jgi:hypothetical protein
MTILYKLTDENMQTNNGFQWNLNEPRTAPGGGELCTDAWLHAYTDPLLAVLLNPIHANIDNPRFFRCEGEVGATDSDLKVGCTKLNLLEELEIPKITTEQRVKFAILCAREVVGTTCPKWSEWATKWLSGEDRTEKSAQKAAGSASGATEWAAQAAEWSAEAEYAAEYAADLATWAATWAASGAALSTEESEKPLDLIALAHEACG